jgi:hypothetical protein
MAFDVAGAREAGYTDTEIADHLAEQANFDIKGARKAGYADTDILTHLTGASQPAWYDKPLFGQKWLGAPKELVTGTRAVLEGAVALPGLPYDVVAGAANLAGANLPTTAQGLGNVLDMAGVPRPPENMTTAAIRGGAGALTGAGAANMLARSASGLEAGQLTMPQFLSRTFAEQPITQGVAGMTAGAAAERAKQSGMGPTGQMMSGLAGGVAPVLGAQGLASSGRFLGNEVGKLGRSVWSGTEAGERALTERVVNELYLRTFGGATPNQLAKQGVTPENIARIEQAARYAQAGETGKTIAVLEQDPVLANFVSQRLKDQETVQATADAALAQRQQLANPLAGAMDQRQADVLAAERALADTQQQLATNKTLTEQQRRQIVSNARAELDAARQNLASLQSQAAGAGAQANQLSAGAQRQRAFEAETTFPPQDLEQLGRQTRSAAASAQGRARRVTRQAYDEADALGAELAPIPAGSVRAAAGNVIGDAGFAAKDVPELAQALSAIRGRTQRGGFMNLRGVEGEPTMTWQELTSVLRAVNADMRSVAQNPELRPKLRNLREVKRSVQGLINSAPEEVIPQQLKDAFANAETLYRQEYVRRFGTGNEQRNMLLNRNGAPVIADENIIGTFFKPGGASPARRFLDMLGDNPVALDSMEAGIRERFRQDVIKNGAVDSAAYAKFMDKYRAPLAIYEEAGVDLTALRTQGDVARMDATDLGELGDLSRRASSLSGRATGAPTGGTASDVRQTLNQLETQIPGARAAPGQIQRAKTEAIESLTDRSRAEAARLKSKGAAQTAFVSDVKSEVKTISDLQAKLNAAPDNPVAAQTMDDVTRAIQDVEKFLSDESQFDELLAFGSGLPNVLEREIKPESAKVPLTIIEEILYNNTNKLLTKNLRGPLAAKIGKELLDSPSLRASLERAAKAAAKRKFRVPLSKQISAGAAAKGATINALGAGRAP